MKVNIDKTLEVTDEQRKQIAARLDGEGARKRDATRDEMKEFIWAHGERWELVLSGEADEPFAGADVVDVDDDDEDLIGNASLPPSYDDDEEDLI